MQKNRSIREKLISVLLVISLMMSYIVTLSNVYVIYASDEEDQVIYSAEIVEISQENNQENSEVLQEENSEVVSETDEGNNEEVTSQVTDSEVQEEQTQDSEFQEEQTQDSEIQEDSQSQEELNKEYALKINVGIKDIGYLKNAKIQIEDLENQIFTLSDVENPIIQSIENGVIKLNNIDAKDQYEIQIPLQIKREDSVNISNIQNGTKIKLIGSYVNEDGEENKVEKEEIVHIEIENNRQISINSNIEKYVRYTQDEKEYAIVQIKVNVQEGNTDLILPVKQTNLKIQLPSIDVQEGQEKPEIEKISVMAPSTGFTNGRLGQEVEFTEENFGLDDNGNLIINVENKEIDGRYRKTNGNDEYLIEMLFNNAQNIQNPVIRANIEATVDLFNKLDTKQEQGSIEQEYKLDDANTNKIIYEVKTLTNEISKGNVYANVNKQDNFYETEYQNEIGINISKANSIKSVEIREQEESYEIATGERFSTTTEAGSDTYYKTTILNKENLVNIIGENGNLEILNEAGENLITLNKDTETNEEGNIVLIYTNKVGKITIRINNPETEGILNIQNVKAIDKSNYTKESLVAFTSIDDTFVATAVYDDDIVSELGTKEIKTNLIGTSTKVDMEISRGQFSTITKNEDVQFNINLNNSKDTSDMYINPEFEIVLPAEFQVVTIKEVNLLYANDEFKIADSKSYVNDEGRVAIYLRLEGTQTTYSQGDIDKGTSIIIKADLEANLYTPNKESQVELKYINPNATAYGSEIVDGTARESLNVQFIGALGIVNAQRITDYDGNTVVMSMNQGEKTVIIPDGIDAMNATMELIVINNGEEVMQNPSILGRIAFDANKTLINEENLGTNTTVKMISPIEKAVGDKEFKVYYSENGEATRELDNPENGWNENVESLDNIKSYLIVPQGNIELGETLSFKYNFQIPEKLDLGTNIYGTFGTYFDTEIATKLAEANKVGLQTQQPEEVPEENAEQETIEEENQEENQEENTSETEEESSDILWSAVSNSTPIISSTTPDSESDSEESKSVINTRKTSQKSEDKNNPTYIGFTENDETKEKTSIIKGETVEYRVRVNNFKAGYILSPNIYIDLPQGVSYKNAYFEDKYTYENSENIASYNSSSRRVSWNYDVLEDYIDIVLEVEIDKSINTDKIDLILNIESDDLDKVYSYTKSYGIINKALEVSYSINSGNKYVKSGDQAEYVLSVRNVSGMTVQNINMKATFPEELKVTSVELNKGDYSTNGYILDNSVSVSQYLNKDESLTVTVKCDVAQIEDAEKVVSNYFTISTDYDSQKSNTIETIIQKSSGGSSENNGENGNGGSNNPNVNLNNGGASNVTGDYKITGLAWNDANKNGQRDSGEKGIENIVVKLYDSSSNNLIRQVVTDGAGGYILPNLPAGSYYAIFEYNSEIYSLSDFKKSGVASDKNSDVILTNGKSKTDTIIIVDSSISNIDIGLIQGNVFDLSLEKTVSKITVQNDNGTSVIEGNDSTLAKAEIKSKDLNSSTVYIEYKIKVTNNGQVPGSAAKIVDYLPKDASLNTEINPGWYIDKDGNAYSEELANTIINPKETKELTLIISKGMTEANTGISSNKAEIAVATNELGVTDIDSTPGNNSSSEDDFGQADVIVSISTGGGLISTMIILTVLINLLLIGYVIKRRLDKGKEVMF